MDFIDFLTHVKLLYVADKLIVLKVLAMFNLEYESDLLNLCYSILYHVFVVQFGNGYI